MRSRTRTHTTTVTSLEFEDVEVELTYQPYYDDDIYTKLLDDGKLAVVAYLVHDDDCGHANPMEAGTCNGTIFTMPSGYACDRLISDNEGEVLRALRLNGRNDPDIDDFFDCEPYVDYKGVLQKTASLRDRAARIYLDTISQDEGLIERWLNANDLVLERGETLSAAFEERRNEIWRDLEDQNSEFWDEVQELAASLYPKHWQEMVSPFVVPISYHAERGGVSCFATTWDGDPDDLPDGVWIADEGAEDNLIDYPPGVRIKYRGAVGSKEDPCHAVLIEQGVETRFDSWRLARRYVQKKYPQDSKVLREKAIKYADAVCREYASWAEGDVYGCVVEVFKYDAESGVWEADDSKQDACWGYVGHEYAMENLKEEFFEQKLVSLERELTAPDPNQGALSPEGA